MAVCGGHAAEVMFAYEQAVSLVPENEKYLYCRGLARALTGDFAGAIADFEAYVTWMTNEENKTRVQGWIEALRAGENPFSKEVLEELRK